MATTVTTGFNGSLAGEIFVQAFLKTDTISKNAITVLPNVIGNGYLPKISYTASLQAYACGFTPAGTLAYNEKLVTTKPFMIQDSFCSKDFARTFAAQALGLFGTNKEIPTTIQDAILLTMVSSMGQILDDEIWNGLGADATSIDGLLKQFNADAAVQKVVLPATTVANVVENIESVYNLVIPAVEDADDLVIVVGKSVAKKYKQAQAAMGINTTVGDKELDYLGVRIESIGGLPADAICIYRVSNVNLLTALESELNEVIIDERVIEGDTRTKMAFTIGVGYSFGEEIVLGEIA